MYTTIQKNNSNLIRFLNNPRQYWYMYHINNNKRYLFHDEYLRLSPDDSDKYTKVFCAVVLDIKTSKPCVFRFDENLYSQIQNIVRHPDWGNPQDYNVDIRIDGQYGPYTHYIVIPHMICNLSPELEKMKSEIISFIDYRSQTSTNYGRVTFQDLYDSVREYLDKSYSSTGGFSCISCGEYNPYAEPNMDDGSYKCFLCRNNY